MPPASDERLLDVLRGTDPAAPALVIAEKNKVAMISMGRRPILSAAVLKINEPRRIPKRPALNTGPSAALGMFQSLISAGAA